jgi:Laminin B (Domain IV)
VCEFININNNDKSCIYLWKDYWVDETGQPVTRKQMMVALQNVQHWLVKAAEQSGRVREAR